MLYLKWKCSSLIQFSLIRSLWTCVNRRNTKHIPRCPMISTVLFCMWSQYWRHCITCLSMTSHVLNCCWSSVLKIKRNRFPTWWPFVHKMLTNCKRVIFWACMEWPCSSWYRISFPKLIAGRVLTLSCNIGRAMSTVQASLCGQAFSTERWRVSRSSTTSWSQAINGLLSAKLRRSCWKNRCNSFGIAFNFIYVHWLIFSRTVPSAHYSGWLLRRWSWRLLIIIRCSVSPIRMNRRSIIGITARLDPLTSSRHKTNSVHVSEELIEHQKLIRLCYRILQTIMFF